MTYKINLTNDQAEKINAILHLLFNPLELEPITGDVAGYMTSEELQVIKDRERKAGYKAGFEDGKSYSLISEKTCIQKGRDEAWNLARRILKVSDPEELRAMFGQTSEVEIIINETIDKCIQDVAAYDTKDQIKEGDIVIGKAGEAALCTRIKDEDHIYLLWPDGTSCLDKKYYWTRDKKASWYGDLMDEIEHTKKSN